MIVLLLVLFLCSEAIRNIEEQHVLLQQAGPPVAGCRYAGYDLANTQTTNTSCGQFCLNNTACTHFTWLSNGFCYLHKYTGTGTFTPSQGNTGGLCGARGSVTAAWSGPDLTGWTLVRRVQPGTTWHPSTDNCYGTQSYGTPSTDPTCKATFSLKFNTMDYNQLLFTTGDGAKWLIMSRTEVERIGTDGNPFVKQIISSYDNPQNYSALMYDRPTNIEDPWFSAEDHNYKGIAYYSDTEVHSMLYGENAFPGWNYWLQHHNGANVFIRKAQNQTQNQNQTQQQPQQPTPQGPGCRYLGYDLSHNTTVNTTCGQYCLQTPGCTHFTWLPNGFCYTHNFSGSGTFAPQPGNVGGLCGDRGSVTPAWSGPDLTSWTLVRRVQPGTTWHPATDNCYGTQSYGTPSTDPTSKSTFSLKFNNMDYNQLLFTTGDGAKWLIMSRTEVERIGTDGNPFVKQIISSYDNPQSYTALMYDRPSSQNPEDPWLSAEDHNYQGIAWYSDTEVHSMLYGENAFSGWNYWLQHHNGANVFIRKAPAPAPDGFWRLVFRQTYGAAFFQAGQWNVNSYDPTAFNFAILDQLETYRLPSGVNQGSFLFRLSWPNTGSNIWIQSSNPVNSTTVKGYQAINVTHIDHNWAGLIQASGQQTSLLAGTAAPNWYYAVGSFQAWQGGIPGYDPATQVVELFVWDATGGGTPDYTLGPTLRPGCIVSDNTQCENLIGLCGRYRLVARQTYGAFFTPNQLSLNLNHSNDFNYLDLGNLDQYRLKTGPNQGSLQFRLIWPGSQNQDWVQSSNPTNTTTVSGYNAVDIHYESNNWVGLHSDSTDNALLSGSGDSGTWFYAIGSFKSWQGGIPAANVSAQVAQLYVLDPSTFPDTPDVPGFYRLVFRQTYITPSAFTNTSWSVNSGDPTAFNYAILDQLEKFRLASGPNRDSFQFKFSWPGFAGNEWVQSSNPVTSKTVSGYQPISVAHNDANWVGLVSNGVYSLLSGSNPSINIWWYFAVGAFAPWSNFGGLPACRINTPVQVVELYVWDNTGAQAPDYTLGPKTYDGQYRLVSKQTMPYFFTPGQWTLNTLPNFNYAKLDNLAQYTIQYGPKQGLLQFRLDCPESRPQIWVQSSDPTQSKNVTGYAPVDIINSQHYWEGLHLDGQYALLSGSSQWPNFWWYAVGSFNYWQTGIPIMPEVASQVAQLYVLDQSGCSSIYTVRSGDTCLSVASQFAVTVQALQQANSLTTASLTVGSLLCIPIWNLAKIGGHSPGFQGLDEKGFYRLVFRQTFTQPSAFSAGTWSLNSNDPTAFNFAILDQLENYRRTSGPFQGSFKFKISWPGLSSNEWVQSSNPTKSNTVTGYQAISVAHNDYSWVGLAANGVYALLSGSAPTSKLWYYAIGAFASWESGGIPAYTDLQPVQVVELFVWDDTGAVEPDYRAGPLASNGLGQYYLVARQTNPLWFTPNQWSVNSDDPTNFNFAQLDRLESYRLTSGSNTGGLQFLYTIPGTTSQEWVQTSNPTTSATVTGYTAINAPHADNSWVGLHTDSGNNALLSGSAAPLWFYAVGVYAPGWQGALPGVNATTQVVQLYVLKSNS